MPRVVLDLRSYSFSAKDFKELFFGEENKINDIDIELLLSPIGLINFANLLMHNTTWINHVSLYLPVSRMNEGSLIRFLDRHEPVILLEELNDLYDRAVKLGFTSRNFGMPEISLNGHYGLLEAFFTLYKEIIEIGLVGKHSSNSDSLNNEFSCLLQDMNNFYYRIVGIFPLREPVSSVHSQFTSILEDLSGFYFKVRDASIVVNLEEVEFDQGVSVLLVRLAQKVNSLIRYEDSSGSLYANYILPASAYLKQLQGKNNLLTGLYKPYGRDFRVVNGSFSR